MITRDNRIEYIDNYIICSRRSVHTYISEREREREMAEDGFSFSRLSSGAGSLSGGRGGSGSHDKGDHGLVGVAEEPAVSNQKETKTATTTTTTHNNKTETK